MAVPRVRGDEPAAATPPRSRGWSGKVAFHGDNEDGSPAFAGMVPIAIGRTVVGRQAPQAVDRLINQRGVNLPP